MHIFVVSPLQVAWIYLHY